jgi:radical SAM protein with 4Fe4S-binding SPASM domain
MDENMARGILDAAPDRITFSFDGESKEIYETMRRGGDYEKVLNNIINFLKIRSQMSSKADVIIQHIKFYSEGEKLDVSDEFKNIFKGYNISKFDTVWAHKWMGVPDNCNYLDGYSGPPVNKDIYYPCPLLWNHFSIGWDGKVFPCNMDLLRLEVMGDVNKDSVRDIWNSRAFQEKRRLLLEKRYTCSSLCKTCAFLWERKEFKGTLLKRGVARFLRTFNRFKKYCG